MSGSGCIQITVSMRGAQGHIYQLHDWDTLHRNYKEEDVQRRRILDKGGERRADQKQPAAKLYYKVYAPCPGWACGFCPAVLPFLRCARI